MFFFSKLLLCTIQNFWTWFLIYLFTSVPLINVLIILYVTKPFKADRCWINLLQFCFKETENTVLFFPGFTCHMDSVVPFVIPRGWISIPSGVNNQNVFKHANNAFYYFSQTRASKAFFLHSFLSSPAQLLQLPSLALMSLTSLGTVCVLKSGICDQSLPLTSSQAWMLTSVALYTHTVYFEDFWEALTRPIYFSQVWPKFIQYSELKLS